MRKKLLYLFGGICVILSVFGIFGGIYVNATDNGGGGEKQSGCEGQECGEVDEGKEECKGIKLNTDFPLIGRCIQIKRGGSGEGISPTEAFPTMVAALTKIVMSVILVVCLIMIIIGGIMIASDNKLGKGKELIKKVAIVILLLGFSSLILKLVNPNFFG